MVCLVRSLLLSTCSLIIQTSSTINLTISLTKWTEPSTVNRCLSSSTNSVHFHFRERVEKTKENAKKTKIENLQNQAGKIWREKIRVRAHLEKNLKNIIISSNCSLKLLRRVIWINFLKNLLIFLARFTIFTIAKRFFSYWPFYQGHLTEHK